MVPGGLKNVLHYKNWTFSTQVFSCRFFSSRFSWPFKDFKDSTPKITFPAYKSDFHWQSNAFLWFDFKTHGLLIKEESENYFTTRDLFISAMSHVKLIKDCCVLRRLSPDKNWRAKEGWKGKTGKTALNLSSLPFQWSLALRHQSLAFRALLFSKPCEKRSAWGGGWIEETRVYICR